jgi:hypothetical protein
MFSRWLRRLGSGLQDRLLPNKEHSEAIVYGQPGSRRDARHQQGTAVCHWVEPDLGLRPRPDRVTRYLVRWPRGGWLLSAGAVAVRGLLVVADGGGRC